VLRFPEFEPEVIAAAARRTAVSNEDVATTAVGSVVHRGVRLSSESRNARELHLLADIVDALPGRWLALVDAIHCNSGASTYLVDIAVCADRDRHRLTRLFGGLVLDHAGGHNGVTISDGAGPPNFVNPRWRARRRHGFLSALRARFEVPEPEAESARASVVLGQGVRGLDDLAQAFALDMGVYLRRRHVGVAEQGLHDPEVRAAL
jgi:hypothetical protein